jgi:hypothetical protein
LFINIASGSEFDRNFDIINIKETEIYNRIPTDYYGFSKNVISKLINTSPNGINLRLFGCFNKNEHITRMIRSNLNNYILCTGSSIAEGIGLPVNKRYSDVLASMLNCDMYNLGLGGSGNDAIFYNLVTWFATVPIKPKLVVIGWTSESRFLTEKDNSIKLYNPSVNEIKDFLVMGDSIGYFSSKTALLKNLIRKIISVPIIEIPWNNDSYIGLGESIHTLKYTQQEQVDLARDLIHPGIKTNHNIGVMLYNYINGNSLLDK